MVRGGLERPPAPELNKECVSLAGTHHLMEKCINLCCADDDVL